MSSLPAQPRSTFRGTDLPASVASEYQVARTVSDAAFVSTSTDVTVAEGFRNGGNALIEIRGVSGRSIDQFSQFSREGEVLFGRNSRFEVFQAVDRGGYTYYVLKEVP